MYIYKYIYTKDVKQIKSDQRTSVIHFLLKHKIVSKLKCGAIVSFLMLYIKFIFNCILCTQTAIEIAK